MATAVVLDKDTILGLIADMFVDAVINGSGQLVLTKQDTTTVTVGYVQDHSHMLHLTTADDHTQYAKADGSRGSFATTTQGTKADNARPNVQAAISFNGDGSTAWVERTTIVNDGTDSSAWVNREEFYYDNTVGGGAPKLTSFKNEYGEYRGVPAKHTTVPWRLFEKNASGDTSHDNDVPMIEIMDDRGTRTSLFSIVKHSAGYYQNQVKDVPFNYVLVLAAAASVPTNTPNDTLIVRLP
jgi:hypothetical protein